MRGVTDLVDISGADALLNVHEPRAFRMFRAHQIGNQRVHPRGGEEHGRVVLRDQGCGRNDGMPLRHKEVEIKLPELFAGHGSHMIKLLLTVQISYIEYSKIQTLVNAAGYG